MEREQGRKGRREMGIEMGARRERERERANPPSRLGSSNTGCKRPLEKSRLAETLTPRASANVKRP